MITTTATAKSMATRLRTHLAQTGSTIRHSEALEIVASQLGFRDWNTASAALTNGAQPITIPILRTFPGGEADRFYLDFLGFTVDWEHRFESDMPLYRQVSRGGCVLHLSEHHEDATPGSAVRIQVDDVERLQRSLASNAAYPLRIGLESADWGSDLRVPDPFGNHLIFCTYTP